MKRTVLILDAFKFEVASLEFAAGIAAVTGRGLTGLFVSDATIGNVPGVDRLAGQMYVEEIVYSEEEQKARAAAIDKNMGLFYDECTRKGIAGIALHENGIPLEVILHESRFADLLIVSPTLTFSGGNNIPTDLVREILKGAECPVLLSAEQVRPVDEVVIAYDGSRSSAFAIKQFSYLLQQLGSKKTTILHVQEEGKTDETKVYSEQFASWMEIHFPSSTLVHLSGNAADVLFNYFMEDRDNNNKLLVAGAFGRNAVSRFFNPGTTDRVLKTIDIPVFITHS